MRRDKAMTMEEFSSLNNLIANHYSMLCLKERRGKNHVKYLQANIDYRTNTVFRVMLYGAGCEKEFHVMNEYREHPKTLLERIVDYLDGVEDEYEKNLKSGIENVD